MGQEKKVYVNKQIAVLKTGNYLVELVDNLKPAATHFTAHIHARGDKYTDRDGNAKRDESSLIQIFMRDYSNKDAESTAVYMNLEPERIRWYHNWVSLGVTEYKDGQEKIFGKPDAEGYSIVTKIWVVRQDMLNGQKKTRPWSIRVENGKGIKQEYPNGAIVCKSGSYVAEKKVTAHLTDYEFYMLMVRGVKYLDAIENRYMMQPLLTGMFNLLYQSIKGLFGKGEALEQVPEPVSEPVVDVEPDQKPTGNNIIQTRQVPTNVMTYETACAVEIPFGQYRGKTFGDMVKERPEQLRWFAESYRGGNQALKEAAKVLLESRKVA